MFEKEAEEYTVENVCSSCYFEKPCENKCEAFGCADSKTYVLKAFKDGAEFGYNKAKEWHYPSKGELPKDNGLLMSKTLNLITKMKGSDCLNLALGKYNFSTQEFDYQHMVGLTEVIAWKEIVLPELKESE